MPKVPNYGQNEKDKIDAERAARREQKIGSSSKIKETARRKALEKKTRMNTMGTPGTKKTPFTDMKNIGGRK